ncbi:hypothetical protein HMPREF3197_02755 [Klebsiella pneumoniae]|nr:hypothetical protein HMPREF3197_02755 [Klebsiella pneumoniae]
MICLIFHPIYMNFIDFIFCAFPSSCVLSYEYRFFFQWKSSRFNRINVCLNRFHYH